MADQEAGWRRWVYLLLLLAAAIVLTVVILLALFPRSFAYEAPVPTEVPWTRAPGLYVIPTVVPPTPTIVSPFATPAP